MTRFRCPTVATVLMLLGGFGAGSACSSPLTPGNILVLKDDFGSQPGVVRELTLLGALVQAFNVATSETSGLRDVAVTGNGSLVIYNGTFAPTLTLLDPATGVASNFNSPGFSTTNTLVGGGIAASGKYAFATDKATGSTSQSLLNGLIRFDTVTGDSQRFGGGKDFIDVSVGADGLAYGLHTTFFPGGHDVEVYDRLTLQLVGSSTLGGPAVYAIAANGAGEIFGGTEEGITRYSPTGQALNSLDLPGNGIVGLDLDGFGNIVAISADGLVFITTESFSSFSNILDIDPSADHNVAFVSRVVPEPGSLILACCGLCLVSCRAQRAGRCRWMSSFTHERN